MRAILLIFLLSWILGLFLPWWTVLIPCLLVGGWLVESAGSAFIAGFTGVGFAWLVQAFYIHVASGGILTTRIADMLQAGSPMVILLITFLIGSGIGALGTLTGYFFKQTIQAERMPKVKSQNKRF